MIFNRTDLLLGVLVGVAVGLIGAYIGANYPNLGFGIVLDKSFTDVQVGEDYEKVVDALGPEQGRLSDELVRLNATSRGYDAIDLKEIFGIPNEVGGENLFWLNQSDGRVFLVVSFGKDHTVRNTYSLEVKHFVR